MISGHTLMTTACETVSSSAALGNKEVIARFKRTETRYASDAAGYCADHHLARKDSNDAVCLAETLTIAQDNAPDPVCRHTHPFFKLAVLSLPIPPLHNIKYAAEYLCMP